MEKSKQAVFKRVIEESRIDIDTWVRAVKEMEPRIRAHYTEDTLTGIDTDRLLQLILVDACYILVTLLNYYFQVYGVLPDSGSDAILRQDLIMVENQVPFFVLDELSKLAFSHRNLHPLPFFHDLALAFFSPYNYQYVQLSDRDKKLTSIRAGRTTTRVKVKHLTDYIRTNLIVPWSWRVQPPRAEEDHNNKLIIKSKNIPSASELEKMGIKLMAAYGYDGCCCSFLQLELNISERVVKIPQLPLDEWTEVFFRNLVALERSCYPPHESFVTDYLALLNSLVITEQDADLLVAKEILILSVDSGRGDKIAGVANLIKGLNWKDVVDTGHENYMICSPQYVSLCNQLQELYKNPWRNRREAIVQLRQEYCNTPWKTAVSIGGILVILLTLVQTVCSVIQVMQGSSEK